MTLTTTLSFRELLSLTTQSGAFFWLVQITSPQDSGITDRDGSTRVVRATTNGVAVPFDVNPSTGQALRWQSWPMDIGEIPSQGDGSLNGVRVGFANVDGYAAALYNLNDEFRDHIVRLRFVNSALLSDPTHPVTFKLRVTECSLDIGALRMNLSGENLNAVTFPLELITRQCGWSYRGPECGFTLPTHDPNNTLGQCAKTEDACTARGQWAVDNGLATTVRDSNWPFRIGGFLALPPGAFAP